MYTVTDITDFLQDQLGTGDIKPESDIFFDLGVSGDDFHEMIEAYAKAFLVDMSGYLWYFHADEEGGGHSIGGAFFKPPYERVTRIPVTPQLLTDMANKGRWDMVYPEHQLPEKRYDLTINMILFWSLLAIIIFWLIYSYIIL